MSKHDRAVAILDLITQAGSVSGNSERAEQLICSTLAKAAGADCGVLVGLRPNDQLGVHAVWPDRNSAAHLAGVALRSFADAAGRSGHHPALGEVVGLASGVEPNSPDRQRGRLLVLSRYGGFTPEARALLGDAAVPLQLLMPYAADACLRDQRARTAKEATLRFNLTARELQVLQLLADGLLARTIAMRLGLSPRTVHKHLGNVYAKMGVHDRLVAVSIARSRGLVAA